MIETIINTITSMDVHKAIRKQFTRDLSSLSPHNKVTWTVTSSLSFVWCIGCPSDQCIAQQKCPPGKFTQTVGSTSFEPKCKDVLCESWCAQRSKPWATKCTWPRCAACVPCSSTPTGTATTVAAPCDSWCAPRSTVWTIKCTRALCAGCSFCATGGDTALCRSWCASNVQTWTLKCTWTDCKGCSACSGECMTNYSLAQ